MQDYQIRVCVKCGTAFVMSTAKPFPLCNKCNFEEGNPFDKAVEQRRMIRVAIRKIFKKVA